jgi:hypothetical protein
MKFCPKCGKELFQLVTCNHCGAQIKAGLPFCPNCGARQNEQIAEPRPITEVAQDVILQEKMAEEHVQEEHVQEVNEPDDVTATKPSVSEIEPTLSYEDDQGSKKWLWIVGVIILLGILGGGGYYFMTNKDGGSSFVVETDSIAEIGDSIPSDLQSVEAVKARLTEILSKALKMYDEDAVNSYFSKEYRELFKEVNEYDNKYVYGEPGFWCGNIWDGGQDGNPNSFTITNMHCSSDEKADAEVKFIYSHGDYHSENLMSLDLVFENGNWYIDNIGGYKLNMKEYISSGQKKIERIEAFTNILNDYAKKGKDSADGYFYFLHDITGDGYSELWVQVCNEDGLTCKLLIYEFKNGAISKIYQEEVGHRAHHSYCMKDNNVYLSYGHMGDSALSIFEYKNGKIQTREISEDSGSEQSFGQEVEIHELTDKESLVYL